jgi:hypothetical protein
VLLASTLTFPMLKVKTDCRVFSYSEKLHLFDLEVMSVVVSLSQALKRPCNHVLMHQLFRKTVAARHFSWPESRSSQHMFVLTE